MPGAANVSEQILDDSLRWHGTADRFAAQVRAANMSGTGESDSSSASRGDATAAATASEQVLGGCGQLLGAPSYAETGMALQFSSRYCFTSEAPGTPCSVA